MDGMKSISVCSLILVLGIAVVPVYSQVSEPKASPKQATSPTSGVAAEKSVLAESSKQAAKPETAAAEFCRCVGPSENSATKRIEQALASPLHQTGLDYTDQPLQDVITQLSDEYGIPIQINKAALKEAGIGTDTGVNVTIHNVSLRSALRLMLKPHQLTYLIEDEVLFITTPEDAEKDLKVCVYDVRRMAGDKGELTPLIETISSCVAKDTWAKNGNGSAEIRSPRPGLLVITQTQAIHNDIRNLLMTLDQMRRDHQADSGGAPTKAAAGMSPERRAPVGPEGTSVPRNGAAPGQPVRSDADVENPFSG